MILKSIKTKKIGIMAIAAGLLFTISAGKLKDPNDVALSIILSGSCIVLGVISLRRERVELEDAEMVYRSFYYGFPIVKKFSYEHIVSFVFGPKYLQVDTVGGHRYRLDLQLSDVDQKAFVDLVGKRIQRSG